MSDPLFRRRAVVGALVVLVALPLLPMRTWHPRNTSMRDRTFGGAANLTWHALPSRTGRWAALDVPGAAERTAPYGINDAGEVVGLFTDSSNRDHAFALTDGVYRVLDVPNATQGSEAQGINDKGDIVGYYAAEGSAATHGFLLSHGKYATIDGPHTPRVTALFGINDADQIIGEYYDAKLVGHGFVWRRGTLTPLRAPDGRNVCPTGIDDAGRSSATIRRIRGGAPPGSPRASCSTTSAGTRSPAAARRTASAGTRWSARCTAGATADRASWSATASAPS